MHRQDFPILNNNLIYLDSGATSLKPQCVIDKITDYYKNYSANAHRGDYDLSLKVDYEYENARDVIKEFINARYREEIIFTSGATDSLNMIATGFFRNLLEENDEIIITKSEHASNVMPWFRLAKEIGCKIKYIPLSDNYYVTLDNLKKVITENTKVIALAEITNVVGDIRPIKEITKLAHEIDAFVVVDGAQSVPHLKTDVQDSDIDFLAFSGHKMCGPTGIGVLYGKKELLDKVIPTNLGGGMNESFDDENNVYLKQLPQRLEAGTPNIAGAIGLGQAVLYLKELGLNNIHKYEVDLRKYLVDKLVKIPHIDIINVESDSGIVAFNVDGIFSQDVAYYLNKYHICVRAGSHCAKVLKSETNVANTLRVSLYFYNTKEEVDLLIDLLKDKNKILREML
jgi:cysteine desulfurase/selenocysteine lyase